MSVSTQTAFYLFFILLFGIASAVITASPEVASQATHEEGSGTIELTDWNSVVNETVTTASPEAARQATDEEGSGTIALTDWNSVVNGTGIETSDIDTEIVIRQLDDDEGSGHVDVTGETVESIRTGLDDNILVISDAYKKRIVKINISTGVHTPLDMELTYRPVTLTLDPYANKVFWSDNSNSLYEASLDGQGKKIIYEFKKDATCSGLAADYINKLLFYTDNINNIIGVIHMLRPEFNAILIDIGLDEPRDIVVSPYTKAMYWTDWGKKPKIEMAYMDGSGREVLVSLKDGSWPNGLTLDEHGQQLYWVDARVDEVNVIDLNTRKVTNLLTEERSHYFAIALVGEFLYISDWMRDYLARMNTKGGPLTQYGETEYGQILGMEAFNANQAFKGIGVCASNNCHHLCLPTGSHAGYACRCSEGFVSQGGHCIASKTTVTAAPTTTKATSPTPATTAKASTTTTTTTTETTTELPNSSSLGLDNFLLVAKHNTKQIIKINTTDGVSTPLIINLYHSPIDVTYDPFAQKVFWTDYGHLICEASIDGNAEKVLMVMNNNTIFNGLAADYTNKLLFYTDPGKKVIGVMSMAKNNWNAIVIDSGLDSPRDIVVSPRDGMMYWTDWGKNPRIGSAYMDGSGREDLITFDSVAWVNGLALDANKQDLYWVDAKRKTVSVINIQTRHIRTLLTEEASHYYSISLVGDYLYVGDWQRKYLTRMRKSGGSLKRFSEDTYGQIFGIGSYDANQVFQGPGVCKYNTCQHLCLPARKGDFTCRCSAGYYVSQGTRCMQATTHVIANETTDVTLSNSTVDISNTTDETNATQPDPTLGDFLLYSDGSNGRIVQVNLSNNVMTPVISVYNRPIALTYDPYTQKVYWSDHTPGQINEVSLDGQHQKVVLLLDKPSSCGGMSADYINKLLFYTDSKQKVVGVVSMVTNSLSAVVVSTDLDQPRAIAVSPHDGVIYWTDWGKHPKIEMANMDGSGREALITFNTTTWVNGLALDRNGRNLYWVNAKTNKINVIDVKTRQVWNLLTEENSHFFSLVSLGDYIYVNDWRRKFLTRMDKRGGPLTRLGQMEATRIYGTVGFSGRHILKGPGTCATNTCHHLCLPVSNTGYTCRCSHGYVSQGQRCIQG